MCHGTVVARLVAHACGVMYMVGSHSFTAVGRRTSPPGPSFRASRCSCHLSRLPAPSFPSHSPLSVGPCKPDHPCNHDAMTVKISRPCLAGLARAASATLEAAGRMEAVACAALRCVLRPRSSARNRPHQGRSCTVRLARSVWHWESTDTGLAAFRPASL